LLYFERENYPPRVKHILSIYICCCCCYCLVKAMLLLCSWLLLSLSNPLSACPELLLLLSMKTCLNPENLWENMREKTIWTIYRAYTWNRTEKPIYLYRVNHPEKTWEREPENEPRKERKRKREKEKKTEKENQKEKENERRENGVL